MKKKLLALLCVLVLLVTAAGISGCRKDLKDNVTNYSMELEFDAENMTLKGKNTVSYPHRGENPVSEVYFQLHANGFRRDAEFKAVSTLYYQKAYPFGMSDGYIEVSAVQCNGVTANFSVGGEDSNVLIVPLLKELSRRAGGNRHRVPGEDPQLPPSPGLCGGHGQSGQLLSDCGRVRGRGI